MSERYDAWGALERLRQAGPLVHCITNYVAMDVTANALLAIGASPAMVHANEEVEDFVSISSASPGVTIYYTVNGSTPTTSSPRYTGPILVLLPTTIVGGIARSSRFASSTK